MDKVNELLKQLAEVCKEEKINLVASVSETGDDGKVTRMLQGKSDEIILLYKAIEDHIESEFGMPIELIELALCREEDE